MSIWWTEFQSFWTASVSSWIVFGFLTWFLTSGSILFHSWSIGFRFWDKAGQGSVLCCSVLENAVMTLAMCGRALSWWNKMCLLCWLWKGISCWRNSYFNITICSEVCFPLLLHQWVVSKIYPGKMDINKSKMSISTIELCFPFCDLYFYSWYLWTFTVTVIIIINK